MLTTEREGLIASCDRIRELVTAIRHLDLPDVPRLSLMLYSIERHAEIVKAGLHRAAQ